MRNEAAHPVDVQAGDFAPEPEAVTVTQPGARHRPMRGRHVVAASAAGIHERTLDDRQRDRPVGRQFVRLNTEPFGDGERRHGRDYRTERPRAPDATASDLLADTFG